MAVVYERLVKEDLHRGYGSVDVTMPGGGVARGTKVGLHTFMSMINVLDLGATGGDEAADTQAFQDAITAARANGWGVYVPHPLSGDAYLIGEELNVAGVDIIGGAHGFTPASSAPQPDLPTIRPTAGARLFRVGPRNATDVANGYTDRSCIKSLKIDLSSAPVGYVAIGSQYGTAKRIFDTLHIRGVSGSVGAKAFAAFRLNGTSESTNIGAYNEFRNIQVLHCADAFDLIADGLMRYDENAFDHCITFACLRSFSIIGNDNTLISCGCNAVPADWNPTTPTGTSWMIKMPYAGNASLGGSSNVIVNFSIDGINSVQRPFFFLFERNQLVSVRDEELYAIPAVPSASFFAGAPDMVQWLRDTDVPVGPQNYHGGVHLRQKSVLAASIAAPHIGNNLIPNNAFWDWKNGFSYATPAAGAGLMGGFVARKNSTSYTVDRVIGGVTVLQQPQSVRLVVNNNTGVTGFEIDLAAYFTPKALGTLGDVCVGMICFVPSSQGTIDGAYVGVDDGRQSPSAVTSVLKYDGSQSFNALRQQAGEWHVGFVNHNVASNASKLLCTFGLNNDGAHAGVGTFYIESVFCFHGYRDAYTAWTPLHVPGLRVSPDVNAQLQVGAAWAPGAIGNASYASTTVTMPGVGPRDLCLASADVDLGPGLTISASYASPNTVRVTITNLSGGSITPGVTAIRVLAWKVSPVA